MGSTLLIYELPQSRTADIRDMNGGGIVPSVVVHAAEHSDALAV
ncbi:hypothetical protein QO004_002284 [Rhizobium mesoamericanum]|nr:hypothetical protein [Rhizobium mesoamericanum]